MRRNKSKKVKLAPGGKFVEKLAQRSDLISSAGSLLGSSVAATNKGGNALSGALQGVAMGAELGPLGAIGGGLIGGIAGLVGAGDAEVQERNRRQQAKYAADRQVITNTQFAKHGGTLLGKRLGVVEGGSLEPLSDDAVEVKANNPSQTDSVELQDAFVDHGEVIDRENRVFSEELGFAKRAKRLEKMKSDNPRFSDANEHIDRKLDKLFEEQENMKKKSSLDKLASGGKIHIKASKKGTFTAAAKKHGKGVQSFASQVLAHKGNYSPAMVKKANFAKNASKWKHEEGGELGQPPRKLLQDNDPVFTSKVMHDAYYRKRAVEGLTPEDLEEYQRSMQASSNNPTIQIQAGDSWLTSRYDFPQYKEDPYDYKLPIHYASYNKPGSAGDKQDTAILSKLKGKKKSGGMIHNDPFKRRMAKAGVIKNPDNTYSYDLGLGATIDPRDTMGNKPIYTPQPLIKGNIPLPKKSAGTTLTREPIDLEKFGTSLATFGPNLVSQTLQQRLQGPQAPTMETMPKLQRVNPNAQLASIDRDARTSAAVIERNTAQTGTLDSSLGNILAKKLAATNQVYGQNNQLNAMIGNQEATLRQGVQARNAERSTSWRNESAAFNNARLRMSTENASNLAGKILAKGREKNEMQRDRWAWDLIKEQFGDSGVLRRNATKTQEEIEKSTKKSKGGRIKKKARKTL